MALPDEYGCFVLNYVLYLFDVSKFNKERFMSITLAMEPEMIRMARTYAAANGTTMSRMIREYFASLVDAPPAPVASRGETFRDLVKTASLRSPKGWKFNRDEANERG